MRHLMSQSARKPGPRRRSCRGTGLIDVKRGGFLDNGAKHDVLPERTREHSSSFVLESRRVIAKVLMARCTELSSNDHRNTATHALWRAISGARTGALLTRCESATCSPKPSRRSGRRGSSRGGPCAPRAPCCGWRAPRSGPDALTSCVSALNTWSEVRGSRLPVGSSASRRRGALATARAIATRCCSPPEARPAGASAAPRPR